MEYTDEEGDWISKPEHLEKVNKEGLCVCGSELPDFGIGRWGVTYLWCEDCKRKYALDENGEAVTPEYYLITEEESLIKLSPRFQNAFDLLSEMSEERSAQQYIEFHPLGSDAFNAYLYAKNGKFIGYVCYGDAKLAAVFLLKEYRDQGIGTKMVEEWYSQTNHDTVPVAAWDDTKPFFRQLSFPVEFV